MASQRMTADVGTKVARPPKSESRHYDSLTEMMELKPMTPTNKARIENAETHGADRSLSWFGIEGGADGVYEAIESGWADGAQSLLRMFGDLPQVKPCQSVRRVLKRGDHGDEFDIHRLYSGGLDQAWTRRARGHRVSVKGVTIVCATGASHRISAEDMFWRGVCALSICDTLTQAGYSVEVIGTGGVSHADKAQSPNVKHQASVTLKSHEQQLDIESLAACLALAGFARTVMFRKLAEADYDIAGNFGVTLEPQGFADDALIVPASITNRTAAIKWLSEAILKITGEAAEFE